MIIITHRTNSLNQLKLNPPKYGCEIDIRNHNKDLILVHDPFDTNGLKIEDWIKHYQHKFIIFNVKEEGLETKLLKILKRYNIKKYFILDESIPYIYKYAKTGFTNFALRVSEFESYKTAILINRELARNNRIKWIWLDTFSSNPIDKRVYNQLIKANFKICFVSPELHQINNKKIWKELIVNFANKLFKSKINPHMVCTKLPEYWQVIEKKLKY